MSPISGQTDGQAEIKTLTSMTLRIPGDYVHKQDIYFGSIFVLSDKFRADTKYKNIRYEPQLVNS